MSTTDTVFKICSKCVRALPATLDHFYVSKYSDGLLPRCKRCTGEAAGKHSAQRRAANPEKARAQDRTRITKWRRKNGVQERQPLSATKRCPMCKEIKDRKTGFWTSNDKTQSYCKICGPKKRKELDWALRMSSEAGVRHRTKFEGESDITAEWLRSRFADQGGRCAWFLIPLITDFSTSYRHPARISMDRLDLNKGYTTDNVVLACVAANLGRCDAPVSVFMDFVDKLLIKE